MNHIPGGDFEVLKLHTLPLSLSLICTFSTIGEPSASGSCCNAVALTSRPLTPWNHKPKYTCDLPWQWCTISCIAPGIVLPGASKETETLGYGGLSYLMKTLQYSKCSVCLLYTVEQGCRIILNR